MFHYFSTSCLSSPLNVIFFWSSSGLPRSSLHVRANTAPSAHIPISPPQVDSSKGPNRVNRQNFSIYWIFWRTGNPEFLGNPEFGDLEIQNCGIQKMEKIKIFKIQIRSAQNVGKAWISKKKSSRPHLGPPHAIFSMDRKNPKNAKKMPIFPWWVASGKKQSSLDSPLGEEH